MILSSDTVLTLIIQIDAIISQRASSRLSKESVPLAIVIVTTELNALVDIGHDLVVDLGSLTNARLVADQIVQAGQLAREAVRTFGCGDVGAVGVGKAFLSHLEVADLKNKIIICFYDYFLDDGNGEILNW